MANPYLGEIRMFAGNFVPYGWAFCDGQLLPISQNTALFSLLGTFYGGNGTTTFGLPNLQGATPMDQGSGGDLTPRSIGETGGEATVRLSQGQLPSHTHDAIGTTAAASSPSPVGNLWASAVDPSGSLYSDATTGLVPMASAAFGTVGSGSPHNNLPPYLAVSFIICLRGVYPSRG
jgi:microcystin-dependent protein